MGFGVRARPHRRDSGGGKSRLGRGGRGREGGALRGRRWRLIPRSGLGTVGDDHVPRGSEALIAPHPREPLSEFLHHPGEIVLWEGDLPASGVGDIIDGELGINIGESVACADVALIEAGSLHEGFRLLEPDMHPLDQIDG